METKADNLLGSPYRNCVLDLLKLLTDEDLTALAKSASGGKTQPADREQANIAILMSCSSIHQFFSKQKITKNLLQKYSFENRIIIDYKDLSKAELQHKITSYWEHYKSSNTIDSNTLVETVLGKVKKEKDECQVNEPYLFDYDAGSIKVEPPDNEQYESNDLPSNNFTDEVKVNSLVCGSSNVNSQSSVRVMSDVFSNQFCEWYYDEINKLQPEFKKNEKKAETVRSDMFCSNAKLEMYLIDGDRSEECTAEGDEACAATVKEQLGKMRLLFSPNVLSGVTARRSAHGLIKVFCCGTLHIVNSIVGIFEQEFGLVRSPIDGTWKIVYSKVNLKKSEGAQPPSLPKEHIFAIEQ